MHRFTRFAAAIAATLTITSMTPPARAGADGARDFFGHIVVANRGSGSVSVIDVLGHHVVCRPL